MAAETFTRSGEPRSRHQGIQSPGRCFQPEGVFPDPEMVRTLTRPAAEIPRERNARLWRQLERHQDLSSRLRWRNALVTANLPLARSVAARLPQLQRGNYDDLVQVASLGLIRAVEAFDPQRRVSFSSFAVPYMRGALLQELRDRQAPVRIPRQLWELRQRAAQLQERRRQRGQAPLDRRSLARQLACAEEQLLEVETLGAISRPRSLEAPVDPGAGAGATCLQDLLADPRSLEAAEVGEGRDPETAAVPQDADPQGAMRRWLREQLAGLDPQQRDLIEGRLDQGCTWVELGQRLGIHPRMAQRRCDATLACLRRAAIAWRASGSLSPASAAPGAGPAAPPEGSAGH